MLRRGSGDRITSFICLHSIFINKAKSVIVKISNLRQAEKRMICKNCNGEFKETLLVCPYCGAENERRAREEQLEYIEDVQDKIEDLKKEAPKEAARKASNRVVKITAVVVAVFFLLLILVWIVSRFMADTALERQNKHLEILEGYYQNSEYDKISDYMNKNDLYGISYYKYDEIAMLYDRMEYDLEDIQRSMEQITQYEFETRDVVWEMMDGLDALKKIYDMEQDGFRYGNEDAAREIEEQYIKAMTEILLLTEEEIEAAVPEYVDEEEANMELAAVVAARMNEKYR